MRLIVLTAVLVVSVACSQSDKTKAWLAACDTAGVIQAELAPRVPDMSDRQVAILRTWKPVVDGICTADEPPVTMEALTEAVVNLKRLQDETA